MEGGDLLGIGTILVLGIGLQWLARLIHAPSILLLLAGGIAVGPVFHVVDADAIFGTALFPVVSLAVGLLLFTGGLELRVADLGAGVRRPVVRLVTVGALVTWLLTAVCVHQIFNAQVRISLLLAAILVVSGPTVVGPLLRLARPREPDATILRWEGVLIDPIGASLGLFCLNAFFVERFSLGEVWREFLLVALVGLVAGVAAAALFVLAERTLLVPEDLRVAVALMLMVAAYVAAERLRPEAGLFATTAMGLTLSNQRIVPVEHLRAFSQPVVALLIGSLFIVLASRVEPGAMLDHLPATLVLVAILVLVIRPVAVVLCTAGGLLSWRQRAFLACMAPRGIVAASTAALYSLRLEELGQANDILAPVTFAVIIALALVYGLGAAPVARLLGVARPQPRGALIVGSAPWAVELAGALGTLGVPTVLADRGYADVDDGDDLPFAVHDGLLRELPDSGLLEDVRDALVVTGDAETDLTAASVLAPELGRAHVWVLPVASVGRGRADEVVRRLEHDVAPARPPFTPGVTPTALEAATLAGHRLRILAPGQPVPPGAAVLAHVGPDGWWTPTPRGRGVQDRLIVLDGVFVGAAAAAPDPDVDPAATEASAPQPTPVLAPDVG